MELWGYLESTYAWDEVGYLVEDMFILQVCPFRGEVHERFDLTTVDAFKFYTAL